METALTLAIYIIALFAFALLGAYTPYVRKLTDNQIHLLVALSAGIFLGILFFLLLPEAIHESEEGNIEELYVMITVLGGFLAILLTDVLIKHFHMASCPCECHQDQHKHRIGSLSAFIGLAVPHIGRLMLQSSNHRSLMPVTILTGAVVALLCNVLSSIPGNRGLIPLNAITPAIGAPVILYVLLKNRHNQL